jgi:predicted AlkP superfamily phosphohydrolase/phosphomutase
MNPPRTLIIGLDGATFDLIKPWSELGYLPTFKKIMAQGRLWSIEGLAQHEQRIGMEFHGHGV